MSNYFYPISNAYQSPFFELIDQPHHYQYPSYDHHPTYYQPHHQSFNPRRQSRAFYPQTRDPEPLNLHPLYQQRQRHLDRNNSINRNLPQNGYPSRRSPHYLNDDEKDMDSIRAERARRLAEAKRRHLAHPQPDDGNEEDVKVEVTLPNGRQCVVPLAWAQKMQSKYPTILTNSMIRPHQPEPSLILPLDQPTASDSDHDSDFYVLDPTQDPSVPVLGLASPPTTQRTQAPSPKPSKHSAEELENAARLIQQYFRTYQSLKHLDELQSKFQELQNGFTYPSPLDLKFVQPPAHHPDGLTEPRPSTKLAFNNPVNRAVLAFEEALTLLQIKADAVLSRGNEKIKNWRKKLIRQIELQLEEVERFKAEAWRTQLTSSNGPSEARLDSKPTDPLPAAHMMELDGPQAQEDEIMNTDAESVSSEDHQASVEDSDEVETPSTGPVALEADSLVIPLACHPAASAENLVIPVGSPAQSIPSHPPRVRGNDIVCPAPPTPQLDHIVLPV